MIMLRMLDYAGLDLSEPAVAKLQGDIHLGASLCNQYMRARCLSPLWGIVVDV